MTIFGGVGDALSHRGTHGFWRLLMLMILMMMMIIRMGKGSGSSVSCPSAVLLYEVDDLCSRVHPGASILSEERLRRGGRGAPMEHRRESS